MALADNNIRQNLESTNDDRKELANHTVTVYFSALGDKENPGEADLLAAEKKTELDLQQSLLESSLLTKLQDKQVTNILSVEAVSLCFRSTMPGLKVPEPPIFMRLGVSSAAFAGLFGAILGQLFITASSRLFLGMRDVGLVLGPPIGAFVMVAFVFFISKRKWLRTLLGITLGVASILEVWNLVRGPGILVGTLRMVRPRFRDSHRMSGAIKRIGCYIAGILLLFLATPKPVYDRESHEKTVKIVVEQWLNQAVILLMCIYHEITLSQSQDNTFDMAAALKKIGKHLTSIYNCPAKDLHFLTSELIQEAQDLGFEGFDGQPAFLESPDNVKSVSRKRSVWKAKMQEKYDSFGYVEEGDEIVVEHEPVIFRGEILKKGVVRKLGT